MNQSVHLICQEDFEKHEAELRLEKATKEAKLEGRQEGRQEVAKVMLTQGVDLQTIAQYTGLDRETIEKLKQELSN